MQTILMGLAVLFVTLGDISLAFWARNSSGIALPLGIVLNAAGIIFYALTLQQQNIATATAVFLGLNIAAVTIAGFRIFGESLSTVNMLGIVLVAVSILLMEL